MMKKKDYSKPRPSLAEQELYKKLNVEATRKMQEDFKKHPFTGIYQAIKGRIRQPKTSEET